MKMKRKFIVSGILMALGATAYAGDLTVSVDKPTVNLTVGQTTNVTFTLQDTSIQGANVVLNNLQDTKANFAGTVILTNSTCINGQVLNPNQSCQMVYQYQPAQAMSAQPLTLTAAYTSGVTQSSVNATSTLSATSQPTPGPVSAQLTVVSYSSANDQPNKFTNTLSISANGAVVAPEGLVTLSAKPTTLAVTCAPLQGSGAGSINLGVSSSTWQFESSSSAVQIPQNEQYSSPCAIAFNCTVDKTNATVLSVSSGNTGSTACVADQQYYFDASSNKLYILS